MHPNLDHYHSTAKLQLHPSSLKWKVHVEALFSGVNLGNLAIWTLVIVKVYSVFEYTQVVYLSYMWFPEVLSMCGSLFLNGLRFLVFLQCLCHMGWMEETITKDSHVLD